MPFDQDEDTEEKHYTWRINTVKDRINIKMKINISTNNW